MAQISVVIPAFNTGKYLEECLDSVLGQTFSDIEVICLDDGSTDTTPEILDRYAALDKRINVIHKQNSGYGDSVNLGIDRAVGKYISIIEPDDYIDANMYATLFSVAEEKDLEVVKADFVEFCSEGEKRSVDRQIVNDEELYKDSFIPREKTAIFYGYVMNPSGLYRRDFLNQFHIRHNTTPGASYQDMGFWFQVMTCASRVQFLHNHFYFYRQDNPNSSMQSREKADCIIKEFDFIHVKLQQGKYYQQMLPGFIFCMWANYWLTYRRVAFQYKEGFLKMMGQEFSELQKNQELDTSMLSAYDRNILQKLLFDPEEIYREDISICKAIHESMSPCNQCILYGAGARSRYIIEHMGEQDREKVLGIAVSSLGNNPVSIYGKIVREISAYEDKKETLDVLIGVSEKYAVEVKEQLAEKGFSSFIEVKV